ncbi:MAG TPA: hypothetical protein VFM90_10945, partial [Cyclobacteriaceae bacterium]|nr:hypothetical protein [Cyclobacteriaceae bacterium]
VFFATLPLLVSGIDAAAMRVGEWHIFFGFVCKSRDMKNLILLIFLVAIVSCGPATQITGSWKNPSPREDPAGYKRVIITSLSQNLEARQTVERDLAAAIAATGVETIQGIEAFPPSFSDSKDVDKDELLAKIRKTGADGIITIALINRETESRYVPGNYGYAPITRFRYYGRFSGYYTTWYPTVISPGYYEEDKVYYIEINLYDAKSEELVWSAQSETYNPGSLTQFSNEFAQVVVARMKKDGVLK